MSGEEGGPEKDPPEGFIEAKGRGPYTRHNGPIYVRPGADPAQQGFFALGRHCNSLGIVHGGMLASFMDGLLGHAVGHAAGGPAVTMHLSIDYLSMARAGEWIQGEARITKRSRDVVFAEARAFVGRREVVRATAVFKVLERRRGG